MMIVIIKNDEGYEDDTNIINDLTRTANTTADNYSLFHSWRIFQIQLIFQYPEVASLKINRKDKKYYWISIERSEREERKIRINR